MKIRLTTTWKRAETFEVHTCYNSLDLPRVELSKEEFIHALDQLILGGQYNIA